MHVHTQTLHAALNAGTLLTDLMQHKELEKDLLACMPWGLSLPAPVCLAQLAVCWTLLLNCVHPQVQRREFYLPDSPSA